MTNVQFLLGTILVLVVFGHSMYTYIKNKAPWQLIVFALFIVIAPIAECIKYYDGVSKLFFMIHIAGVPIFTSVLIFWVGKILGIKKCYKKDMFRYSFISFVAWTGGQIYSYQEILNIYIIFSSSVVGFLITIMIISTMNPKKNYAEYITK